MDYTHVFLKTDALLESVAEILARLLGRPFSREEGFDGTVFVATHGTRLITLAKNRFVERGAIMRGFDFDIELDGRNYVTRVRYALRLANKLVKRHPSIPLLITDQGEEVGRHEPGGLTLLYDVFGTPKKVEASDGTSSTAPGAHVQAGRGRCREKDEGEREDRNDPRRRKDILAKWRR